MLLPRHRHRIGGESGIGPRLPADCIGEAAGVDREKVDPRIDILPHRHAPPFLARSEVALRHSGAVMEVEAGILALADRRHGARHDAIEIGAEGKRPFLFREPLDALKDKMREEAHRLLHRLAAESRRIPVGHHDPPGARVLDPVEEIPDALALHPEVAGRYIDIDLTRGLKSELQRPDVAGKVAIASLLDERCPDGRLLRFPGEIAEPRGDLGNVGAKEGVIAGAVGGDDGEHARGQSSVASRLGRPGREDCRRRQQEREPGPARSPRPDASPASPAGHARAARGARGAGVRGRACVIRCRWQTSHVWSSPVP